MHDAQDWYGPGTATFGDRLAGAREALGMSQADLARRLGVALRTLKAWENDLSEPRANRVQMLAGLLGVSLTWLLNGVGDGLAGPREEAGPDPAEVRALLREVRELRDEMTAGAVRITRIESRLRQVLTQEERIA